MDSVFKLLVMEKDDEKVAKMINSINTGFILAILHDKHTLVDLSVNRMNQTVKGELAKTPIFNAFVVKAYDRSVLRVCSINMLPRCPLVTQNTCTPNMSSPWLRVCCFAKKSDMFVDIS